MASDKSKFRLWQKLTGFINLTPNSCTHIDVQKQLTSVHHTAAPIGFPSINNQIAPAGSLAMGQTPKMNNSTPRSTIPADQVPSPVLELQEQKISRLLHVLLDEKLVEEKIRQILHEFMDGMANQVLLHYGTADLSADVMESKVTGLEDHLEIKTKELGDSLEKEEKLQMELDDVKSKQSASSSLHAMDVGESLSPTILLQEALNDVHKALMKCASNLYSGLTEHLQAQNPASVLFFQQQLCTSFFTGFETLSFNVTQDLNQPVTFEKPKDLKLRLFQEFNHYKTLDVIAILHNKEEPFQAFMDSKRKQFICHVDPTPFPDAIQRYSCLNSILHDSERYPVPYLDFMGLGKATWLLHRLAFALEPTAEIFRVLPNSNYDPEYMKADQELEGITKVYMAVPGFTFRNLVFKAYVYLWSVEDHL